jgi:hypothetical protein
MATAWGKMKAENLDFTLQDILKIYYGESYDAKDDHSVC